jgi:renalase
MRTIAIIGAGCSGLTAAHTLRDAGWEVALYEQNQGVGGRTTTRTRSGFTFDPGAQYIKRGNPTSVQLITERFSTPDLIDIAKPISIFDGSGSIQAGDPIQNAEPRWNYRHGLITLPRLMAATLDIHFSTSISHIVQTANGWTLFDAQNHEVGSSEYLLISIPAPQALPLLATSQLDSHLQHAIQHQLALASYNPLISLALGYHPCPVARPYYALVNTDRAHPISWLAWEHEKSPERVPDNSGLLIAQMAPYYSREHWQTSDEELIQDAARHINHLIGENLPPPHFADVQRWPAALPTTKAEANTLNELARPHRLAFCGDAFVGGRVHLALEHGITVATEIA